jgi:hypothetical protein
LAGLLSERGFANITSLAESLRRSRGAFKKFQSFPSPSISPIRFSKSLVSLKFLYTEAKGVPEFALFGPGFAVVPRGDRSKLLSRINMALSRMNETKLARATKMLEAFAGP